MGLGQQQQMEGMGPGEAGETLRTRTFDFFFFKSMWARKAHDPTGRFVHGAHRCCYNERHGGRRRKRSDKVMHLYLCVSRPPASATNARNALFRQRRRSTGQKVARLPKRLLSPSLPLILLPSPLLSESTDTGTRYSGVLPPCQLVMICGEPLISSSERKKKKKKRKLAGDLRLLLGGVTYGRGRGHGQLKHHHGGMLLFLPQGSAPISCRGGDLGLCERTSILSLDSESQILLLRVSISFHYCVCILPCLCVLKLRTRGPAPLCPSPGQ